jgi:hypothetical protein
MQAGMAGAVPGKKTAVRGREALVVWCLRALCRVPKGRGMDHCLWMASSVTVLRWSEQQGLGRPDAKHFIEEASQGRPNN